MKAMGFKVPATYRNEIAKHFKAKRISLGLQQIDVAKRGDVSSKTISLIETANNYSVAKLIKACEAMGVGLKDVCNGSFEEVQTLVSNTTLPQTKQTKVTIGRGKNKDWSITIGGYRLTLSGIGEPDTVLLEKI